MTAAQAVDQQVEAAEAALDRTRAALRRRDFLAALQESALLYAQLTQLDHRTCTCGRKTMQRRFHAVSCPYYRGPW